MYWIISLLIFSIILFTIIEVIVKEAYWTNIVESVQIFEHLNKLPSKRPLYETNEFQILELLLVAMVSDLGNHFCSFSSYSFHFIYVSTYVVTRTGLHLTGGVGQGTWRVGACVKRSCRWSCGQWILVLCLLFYRFFRFVSTTRGLWLLWFPDQFFFCTYCWLLCSNVGCCFRCGTLWFPFFL